MNKKRVGKALILALCTVSIAACQQTNNSSGQSNSSASEAQMQWTAKTEKQLRDAIAQAPANGLKPDLFLKGDLPADDAQRYAMLTQAAEKYAEALAHGYSDPKSLFEVYTIPRPSADVRQGLTQAIQNGNVGEWLASLPPQTPEYKALSQAHLHYVQLATQNPNLQPIPDGDPIKPGSRDPRVAAVAAALRATGLLNSPAPQPANVQGARPQAANASAPTSYSPELVAAVKQLQTDFGMKVDGIIGGETLRTINLGPAGRARAIAVTMERLRWLKRDPAKTRIDVNTAGSFLDYWRDGQHVDHRKVINGEPDKPTPQLQAPMFQLVAKPVWNIPDGIAAKELATKSPGWLSENGYTQKDGKWIQQSGPKNSLGLVKFDMKDDEAIYLHDTPAKAVFAMPDRHRSHGCVRVENAVQFATALAQQEGISDKFQQAMQKDDQSFVKLPKEIPVRLIYQTVFWDGSKLQFRPDVYGWDENVAKALELKVGEPRKIEQPESDDDVGP
jgi:murein L,D-transpeptidase YcbB/YkuD